MNHKFALMDHQIHQLYPHFHRSRLIVGWFFQLSTAFNDPKILHPWPWPLKNPLFHGPRWPPFRISSQWADTELLSPRKSIRVPSSAGPCTGGKASKTPKCGWSQVPWKSSRAPGGIGLLKWKYRLLILKYYINICIYIYICYIK